MDTPVNSDPAAPRWPGEPSPPDPRTSAPPPPPYDAPPAPAPPRRGRPWSFWIAIALFLLLGFSVILNLGLAVLAGSRHAAKDNAHYEEQYVEGQGDDKIAVIDVHGLIFDGPDDGLFGGRGGESIVERTVKQLRQAAEDSAVKAVILSVDSPGGGVTASDTIYNEVKKTREAGKKIVVHMGDLCASGGYYISAPADRIVASPTSITGSIGVIMTHLDAQELMEKKLGIKETPIKSGPHKDILSVSRPMTSEELALLQGLVDRMYERFVSLVVEGRQRCGKFKGTPAEAKAAVKKLADGSIFMGDEAEANGLADKQGYLEDAYAEARQLAGLAQATVVRYVRTPGLLELLGVQAAGRVNINAGVQIETGRLFKDFTPRLEFRWAPGK